MVIVGPMDCMSGIIGAIELLRIFFTSFDSILSVESPNLGGHFPPPELLFFQCRLESSEKTLSAWKFP